MIGLTASYQDNTSFACIVGRRPEPHNTLPPHGIGLVPVREVA
jgi:hypothetical protein